MFSISNALRKLFPDRFLRKVCYSQCGEDLVLAALMRQLGKTGPGFYLDVGAYHPFIGSNTYLFYRQGWRGINLDPRPGIMAQFNKFRPNDINLEFGIGDKTELLCYYMLESEPGLNTFNFETLQAVGKEGLVTSTIDVPVITLADVQQKHVPNGTIIDFVSIDTEGFEIKVLSTFDFSLHRPKVFALECNDVTTFDHLSCNDVDSFMRRNGYVPVAKNMISLTVATVFYMDSTLVPG
ncbi:MAG: FkbM family methyltransferase [Bacteroidota bacterium]